MISCAQLGTAVSCPYAAKQAGQGTVRQAACLGGLFEKPFKCRRPGELICSEIKGDASDRATYATRESGYIIFFFFFNRWHPFIEPVCIWWVCDLKPPCAVEGHQAPPDPPAPSP